MKKWEELPAEMQTPEVKYYYDILRKKRTSLFFRRVFDVVVSALLLLLLSPALLLLGLAIKLESPGPVFFRQVRVTQYNKTFRIFKFRSMTQNFEDGLQLTIANDPRITRIGRIIRKTKLDELGQLLDVLRGTMSLVGTRPEVPKYTALYTPRMLATLLLPAGITSLASLYYADEASMLVGSENAEQEYREKVLPQKMEYNLKALAEYSFWGDIRILGMTFLALLGKSYRPPDQAAGHCLPQNASEIGLLR